jgi:hypothetical protein
METGGGRAGFGWKRDPPLTHPQNFYKNFFLPISLWQYKPNLCITSMEEKPCKWGKVPDFSGLYKGLTSKKVILEIPIKFFG